MNGLLAVTHFLLISIFGFVIMILWFRLGLRYFRISSLQPGAELIYRLTAKPFNKINALLPIKLKGRYDWLTLIILIVIESIKFICLGLLFYQQVLPLSYLLILVLASLVVTPCNFLFYLIVFRVLMSWINPYWVHPVYEITKTITNPLLSLGRKIVAPVAGIDFSPFIVMIILKALSLFISASVPVPLL